jgi:cytochrome c
MGSAFITAREAALKNRSSFKVLMFGIAPMLAAFSASAADAPTPDAIDANAAIALAKSQSCLRCHGVTKEKEGPPYAVIAKFYRHNKDAEAVLIEHVTAGAKVKLSDGHKENHKAILDKSPDQIRNLVRWILSQ